jgi:phosphate transport system substrate-binding protein
MKTSSTRSGPRRLLALAAVGALALTAAAVPGQAASSRSSAGSLTGAGSTLVYPLVSQWGSAYQSSAGVGITYGSIGSGAGIAQITARTVDFGASDAPMTPDQASKANGVLQIPWALAATVVSYNVPGIKAHLHLTGSALANIFLGQIKTWNDPRIKKLNPKAALPDLKITPVYRSDGSGDTFVFTDYLTQVSAPWRANVGNSTQVQFPTGVGAKGNDGVAGVIKSTSGAIGYVSLSYDFANGLQFAVLRNAAGQYPAPSIASISEAAKSVGNIPASNSISIVNPPKAFPKAYPMSTFTYALVPQKSSKADLLKPFLTWAITSGQAFGPKLAFAPLPKKILAVDTATIAKIGSSAT